MSEQLTQAEIDALREAVRSGRVEDVAQVEGIDHRADIKVVSYDFRKPKLVSAERMVQLQIMHQSLVKNLQSMLFSMFKVSGEAKLMALDQVSYGEYVLSLASPSYLIGMQVGPDIGPAGMELSPPLGQILLDMLLGGDGSIPAREPPHEFSAFELEIMRTLSERLMEEMTQCWKPVHDIDFHITAQGVSPEQVQITPPDTPCLVAVIDMRILETSVRLHICYPFNTLQVIYEKADLSHEEQMGKRAEIRRQVLRAVQNVPLPIHVELGRATISARELDSLEVGDIILLDHPTGDPLKLNVGERTIGLVYAGAHRGRLAASVQKVLQPQRGDSNIVSPEKTEAPGQASAAAAAAPPPPPRPQAQSAAAPPPPRPVTPKPQEKAQPATAKGKA